MDIRPERKPMKNQVVELLAEYEKACSYTGIYPDQKLGCPWPGLLLPYFFSVHLLQLIFILV